MRGGLGHAGTCWSWPTARRGSVTDRWARARQLLDFTWDFQGLDRDRPDTWYPEREYRSDLDRDLYIYGFVEAYLAAGARKSAGE